MKNSFKFTHRKGRCIQVCFAYAPNKWVSTGTHDMSEAILWASQHMGIALPDVISKNITVGDFAKPIIESNFAELERRNIARGKIIKSSRYKRLAIALTHHVIPYHSTLKIRDLTPVLIENLLIDNVEGNGSIKNLVLQAYKLLLDEAMRSGIIERNVASLVQPFIVKSATKDIFTKEEYKKLFPNDLSMLVRVWGSLTWAGFFLVMRDTGFRPNEVSALSPQNISEKGEVYTESSIDDNGFLQHSIKTTNSGQAYKIGCLTDLTLKVIDLLRPQAFKNIDYALFSVRPYMHIRTNSSGRKFLQACKRVGIDAMGRTQYSLRHTFNTWVYGNVSDKTRLELMGHTINEKTYDHRTAIDRLNKLEDKDKIRALFS